MVSAASHLDQLPREIWLAILEESGSRPAWESRRASEAGPRFAVDGEACSYFL